MYKNLSSLDKISRSGCRRGSILHKTTKSSNQISLYFIHLYYREEMGDRPQDEEVGNKKVVKEIGFT